MIGDAFLITGITVVDDEIGRVLHPYIRAERTLAGFFQCRTIDAIRTAVVFPRYIVLTFRDETPVDPLTVFRGLAHSNSIGRCGQRTDKDIHKEITVVIQLRNYLVAAFVFDDYGCSGFHSQCFAKHTALDFHDLIALE